MNIQELATCSENKIPVKVFIMNNGYLGMVRQWQELFWDKRYSQVEMGQYPDFVKLADAFGAVGRRVEDPAELDDAIREMLDTDRAFILDVAVDPAENCFPMIPSGAAHNEMLLGPEDEAKKPVSEEGMVLV
jgi:acetolactate synthase-1/2/3 large subunit